MFRVLASQITKEEVCFKSIASFLTDSKLNPSVKEGNISVTKKYFSPTFYKIYEKSNEMSVVVEFSTIICAVNGYANTREIVEPNKIKNISEKSIITYSKTKRKIMSSSKTVKLRNKKYKKYIKGAKSLIDRDYTVPSWTTKGFYRHYKSGLKVWIPEQVKSRNPNLMSRRKIKNKEYVV